LELNELVCVKNNSFMDLFESPALVDNPMTPVPEVASQSSHGSTQDDLNTTSAPEHPDASVDPQASDDLAFEKYGGILKKSSTSGSLGKISFIPRTSPKLLPANRIRENRSNSSLVMNGSTMDSPAKNELAMSVDDLQSTGASGDMLRRRSTDVEHPKTSSSSRLNYTTSTSSLLSSITNLSKDASQTTRAWRRVAVVDPSTVSSTSQIGHFVSASAAGSMTNISTSTQGPQVAPLLFGSSHISSSPDDGGTVSGMTSNLAMPQLGNGFLQDIEALSFVGTWNHPVTRLYILMYLYDRRCPSLFVSCATESKAPC
jgi:hypothetical protein